MQGQDDWQNSFFHIWNCDMAWIWSQEGECTAQLRCQSTKTDTIEIQSPSHHVLPHIRSKRSFKTKNSPQKCSYLFEIVLTKKVFKNWKGNKILVILPPVELFFFPMWQFEVHSDFWHIFGTSERWSSSCSQVTKIWVNLKWRYLGKHKHVRMHFFEKWKKWE